MEHQSDLNERMRGILIDWLIEVKTKNFKHGVLVKNRERYNNVITVLINIEMLHV